MPARQKPILVLATTSRDKIKEIKKVLGASTFSYFFLSRFPNIKPAKETGKTFKENAALKAKYVAQRTGLPALADDSGICVKALNGAPGIRSSRWAGEKATDTDRNNKLLERLRNAPWKNRKAYYDCAIALAVPVSNPPCPPLKKGGGSIPRTLDPSNPLISIYSVEAKCRGFIAFAPSGKNGFGYDPIFYIPEYNRTMAQLPLKTKNRVSHRGKALKKIKKKLKKIFSCSS